MRYACLAAISVLALLAACSGLSDAEVQNDPSAVQCPAFATYDPAALRRVGDPARNPNVASYDEGARRLIASVPVPPEVANATTLIRVSVPPSGMWRLDNTGAAWKDESGQWWVALRQIDYRAPPPMPIPVPYGQTSPPLPTMEERFPLRVGPASAATAARLDAYLADPCLNAEPTRFPSELPRLRAEPWLCAHDSSLMVGEIVEPGRERLMTVACENELVTTSFLRFLYSGLAIEPGREERRTQW